MAQVQRFNADPTIDVMLLTTHVGGLGLNLTAADTVIFLEHDYNPMKDLQVRRSATICFQVNVHSNCLVVLKHRWTLQVVSSSEASLRTRMQQSHPHVEQGNPAQAMDRAHRLGQRRTVNVYRVLTRGTLEEKIMGLQRFKLDVAAAVVNSDNVSLSAMDTSKLLDLFAVQVPHPTV